MSLRKYSYYLASIVKLMTGIKPWPRVLKVFLRLSAPELQLIELRDSGLRFQTRGVMDIWSVKETFLDRFYERFGTTVGKGWTVMDIGGGIGDFTIFAAHRNPENMVYAFEPTPQSFALLQENLHLNGVNNVQAFPEAIWSENGTLAIDTSIGEPGQFTSHQVEGLTSAKDGQVLVPSISLADAFSHLGDGRCDLMKMDCEGAEYDILFSAPDEVLERIDRLVMEYHDSVTSYTHKDLAAFLTQKGFQVESFPNFVHADLGYLRATRIPN